MILFEKALGTVGKILRTLATRVISIRSTFSDSCFSSFFFFIFVILKNPWQLVALVLETGPPPSMRTVMKLIIVPPLPLDEPPTGSYAEVFITYVAYIGAPGLFSFPDSQDLLEVLRVLPWQ